MLTDRKAKRLASVLKRQSAVIKAKIRLPFIEPLVFLSSTSLNCRLLGQARAGVFLRGRPGDLDDDGIVGALSRGVRTANQPPVDLHQARTIARGFDKVEYVGVGLHRPREGASIHHPREDGQYECEALWFAVEGRPERSAREGTAQGEGKDEGEREGESDADADADGEEGPTLVPVPQADCQALRERLLEMPRA